MIRHRRTRRKSGNRIILYTVALLALGVMHLYHRFFNDGQSYPAIEISAPKATEAASAPSAESSSSAPKPAPAPTQQAEAIRNDIYRTGWAELPAERKDKELYYTHHTISSESRRNYSVCFSREHRCPVWVAYPLHASYKGETKRSDSFTFDPTLPMEIQPLLRRSFGEYTRGHMLGSAERTSSSEANKQTFYATNVAPQIQAGFNSSNGAWNNMERMVDRQVCADTLYVVTGCLFEEFSDTNGIKIKASTTINKNDQQKVGVPTAFYKVLLRTRKGNTGRSVYDCKAEDLKCAAFIVGHCSAAGRKPTAATMMSVKELEQITGIEFFASVKNAPKDRVDAKDWGL